MHNVISPTEKQPVIVLAKETPHFVTFKKYWVVTDEKHFCQYLVTSSCKYHKSPNCDTLTSFADLQGKSSWSKPQQSDDKDCLIFCHIENSGATVFIETFEKPQMGADETSKNQNYSYANNPNLILSSAQAKILWYFLDRQGRNETADPTNVGMQTFLSNWPGINRIDTNGKTDYQKSPFFQETIFASYSTTVEEATTLYLSSKQQKKEKQPTPVMACVPPKLEVIEIQPTYPNPPTPPILLKNPINHDYTLPKNQPSGNYTISIVVTPRSLTRAHREVAYATPLESYDKNPHRNPIALSPLKSTISLLCWDSNQESQTYGQPIIEAIDVKAASPLKIQEFLLNYSRHLTPSQIELLTSTINPTRENDMASIQMNCKHCGQTYSTNRDTNVYCSPRCRIDHNAGKVYGQSKSKESTPVVPADSPTREEFQALSAQMAQVLHLLNKLNP